MPKIRIKQMGKQYACQGFFPMANVKLRPGEVMEVDDDLAEKCVNTGLVEVVWEKQPQEAPRRGRPPKERAEDDQGIQ